MVLVAAGQIEDKPEVCTGLSGAGVLTQNQDTTPTQIKKVQVVLCLHLIIGRKP